MSRSRGDRSGGGLDGLVFWLVLFAFFGPALALKFASSLNQVIAILAPYATVLVVSGVGLYIYRSR